MFQVQCLCTSRGKENSAIIRNSYRVLVLTFLCTLFAQADTLSCEDPGSSLLWEIQGNNSTVHLFGSLHLGQPAFYPLPNKIDAAFRAADHVVFEMDPRHFADPSVQARMLNAGMLPAGQRLDDVLSADILDQLQTVLATTGLPVEQVMGFRPWFLTTLLATLQYAALGYSPDYGVEQYLAAQLPAERPILSLETMEQQLATLQHLDGEAFLAHSIAEFKQGQELAQQLVTAWRCADKEQLTALLHQGFTSDDEELAQQMSLIHEKLFVERNVHMARQIQHFLKNGEGRYFVVIGSGHYLGEDSIIDMLQRDGYAVKSVRLEP